MCQRGVSQVLRNKANQKPYRESIARNEHDPVRFSWSFGWMEQLCNRVLITNAVNPVIAPIVGVIQSLCDLNQEDCVMAAASETERASERDGVILRIPCQKQAMIRLVTSTAYLQAACVVGAAIVANGGTRCSQRRVAL